MLFSFHGKINQSFRGPEPGDFYGEQRYVHDGKWIYENNNVNIQKNDIIHYWIFVQHDKLGYELFDQHYLVRELVNRTTIIKSSSTTRPTPTTIRSTTVRPTLHPVTEISLASTITEPSSTVSTPLTTETPNNKVVDCELSQTVVMGKSVCKGTLIFEDNFNSNDIYTKWKREIKIPLDTEVSFISYFINRITFNLFCCCFIFKDAEFVSYQNSPNNLFIQNGFLWILPKLQTDYDGFNEERMRLGELNLNNICTGVVKPAYECYRKAQRNVILPPIVSAKISTKDLFSFKYGKIEIRAKFPSGDWILPRK